MFLLTLLEETPVEEEVEGFPQALTLGVTAFVIFAVLLILVTRLNLDR